MKKLLVVFAMLISMISFGQDGSIGLSFPNGAGYIEYRNIEKKFGLGFELGFPNSDKWTASGEDYSSIMSQQEALSLGNEYLGVQEYIETTIGLYYITPSYKGFDLLIGLGIHSTEYYQQYFDNDYILSLNGNFIISDHVDSKGYILFGLTKSIRMSKLISIELKQINRINKDGFFPTIGLGMRFSAL